MQVNRRLGIGVAVGAVVFAGLNAAWDAFLPIMLSCCSDETGTYPLWFTHVSTIVAILLTLVPGFIGAWIAVRHGLLVGFLAGFVGMITLIVKGEYLPERDWGEVGAIANNVVWLAVHGIASGLTSAVAGGTAELLRSNNALERTRDE